MVITSMPVAPLRQLRTTTHQSRSSTVSVSDISCRHVMLTATDIGDIPVDLQDLALQV